MMNKADNKTTGEIGLVFDVQRYSLHDGPGIRTLVFVKGCPLRCKWCANPEGIYKSLDVFSEPSGCIGCGKCMAICPAKAIAVTTDGFAIDRTACRHCGSCARVCPSSSKTLVGEAKTVDQIVKMIRRDSAFYESSGGGVTMGGGEILTQPEFVINVLRQCREIGINTAVETSAFGTWEDLRRIIEYTDTAFIDLKAIDRELHRELTGVYNECILKNIRKADQYFAQYPSGRQLIIRIPVIPGMNDREENREQSAAFLGGLQGYARVELLPFHNFGESKYKKLDKEYAFQGIKNSTAEMLQPFLETLLARGIKATVSTW